jgi:pimeloyl-ACP methyl ester carboxylesterase
MAEQLGLGSPRAEQIWAAYCSLPDPPTGRRLRTLRSVVDYRGQSVSALSRLRLRSEVATLVIWGERDQIIPVEHGYGVQSARPGSRLEVLAGLGHFPMSNPPPRWPRRSRSSSPAAKMRPIM